MSLFYQTALRSFNYKTRGLKPPVQHTPENHQAEKRLKFFLKLLKGVFPVSKYFPE
jgi:hypothetical protein